MESYDPAAEGQALRQVLQATKGGRTRVADVPEPALRSGGVLVRTECSVISAGTERLVIDLASKSLLGKAKARPDLVKKTLEKLRREGFVATYRAVSGRLSGDVPLGYSMAGRVVAVGDRVRDLGVGDRVACAGAGYANHAEVNFVPRNLAARVPTGVEPRHAAAATLGAIALHGVRTADVRLGEVVVVVGLGLLGQLAVQMLVASGARVVAVDLDTARAELAKTLGATAAVAGGDDPEPVVRGLTGGHGADAALVCAGSDSSEPLALAARLCRRRGVVTLVGATGMELDRRTFYEKELSFRMSTSYGPGRYDPQYEERGIDYPYPYVRWTEGRNLSAVLDLIASGAVQLDSLLTHSFDIGDAERAYDLVTGETSEPFLGILLRYDTQRALAPVPAASAPATGSRIGLIGAGQFATAVLIPALEAAPGVSISAVTTASGATADAVARAHSVPRVASSADDVIGAHDVDAIVVVTRHDSHAALVSAALAAGKPCFVEKPLSIDAAGLDRVLAAMSARPGLVCVGFNRRFAPAVRALRTELESRPSPCHAHYRVNAGRLPDGHWTLDPVVGGGRIVGEACHMVDLLTFVVGAPVVRVHAESLPPDGVSTLLRFADGSTAVLDYITRGAESLPKEQLSVHWEGVTYEIDDFRALYRHGGGGSDRLWRGAQDKGHAEEIAAFAQAVVAGGSSPVPFEEAVAATRVTFAIERAMRSGSAVDPTG